MQEEWLIQNLDIQDLVEYNYYLTFQDNLPSNSYYDDEWMYNVYEEKKVNEGQWELESYPYIYDMTSIVHRKKYVRTLRFKYFLSI